MDKRERVLACMNHLTVDRPPVGFWFHFSDEQKMGAACVQAHLDYYNHGKRYENSTLVISDMQKFLKRLRQHAHRHGLYEDEEKGCKIFYVGEYGSRTSRAHYHLLLYGVKIPDLKVLKRKKGIEYKISETISNLWGMGNIIIGELNFKTCSYVAKYVMKKYCGPDKMQVYKAAGRTPPSHAP